MANKVTLEVTALVQNAFRDIQNFTRAVNQNLNMLGQGLQTGLGIDIARRFLDQLQRIPATIENAVKQGIEFNRTLEDARIGIAAVLRQFDAQKFNTFEKALRTADSAIGALQKKALESPATFRQLVGTFQALTGPATGAGISLEKQVDLVVLMSQALSGLGIRTEQLIQESRALITGNINQDAAAAKILGITSADITRAKEAGQLYEFLWSRLSAFSEAGEAAATSLTVAQGNLADALEQTFAVVSRPIFETLRQSFLNLTKEIGQGDFRVGLQSMAEKINLIVKGTFELASVAVKNVSALVAVFESMAIAVTAAATAFVAFKAQAFLTAPATQFGIVVTGIVSAIYAGVEAWRWFKAAKDEALSAQKFEESTNAMRRGMEEQIEQLRAIGRLTEEQAAKLRQRLAAGFAAGQNDQALRDVSKEIREQYLRLLPPPEAKSAPQETEEARVKRMKERLETLRTTIDLSIAERKLEIERTEFEISKGGPATQEQIDRLRSLTKEIATLIEQKKQLVEFGRTGALQPVEGVLPAEGPFGDAGAKPFLTSDEASALTVKDEGELLAVLRALDAILQRLRDIEAGDFFGRLLQRFTEFRTEVEAFGKNVADFLFDSLQRGVQGVSDTILGAIDGTLKWGQVWGQITRQILGNLISITVQYIASKLAMMAVDAIFSANSQREAKKTAVVSGIAGLSKASEQGGWVGALIYLAVYAASLAAIVGIIAGATGGFEKGGRIRGGRQMVQVNERGEEFVVNAPNTARTSPALELINAGDYAGAAALLAAIPGSVTKPITSSPTAAEELPGLVSPAAGAGSVNVQPTPVNVVVVHSEAELLRVLESRAAGRAVVQHIRANRNEAGFET